MPWQFLKTCSTRGSTHRANQYLGWAAGWIVWWDSAKPLFSFELKLMWDLLVSLLRLEPDASSESLVRKTTITMFHIVFALNAVGSWVRDWGWYSSMRSIGLATSPSRGGASQQHRMRWAVTMVFSQCREYLVSVVSKLLSLSSLFQQLHHLRPSPSPSSTWTRASSLPPHTACQNLNSQEGQCEIQLILPISVVTSCFTPSLHCCCHRGEELLDLLQNARHDGINFVGCFSWPCEKIPRRKCHWNYFM